MPTERELGRRWRIGKRSTTGFDGVGPVPRFSRAVFSSSHWSEAGSATLRGLGEASGRGATSSARRWARRGALVCDLMFSFSGARVFLGVFPWTRGVLVIEPSGGRPGRMKVASDLLRASFLLASGSSNGGGVTTIIGTTVAPGKRPSLMPTGPPGAKAAPAAMLARMRAGTLRISGSNVGTGSATRTFCLALFLATTQVPIPSSRSPRRERPNSARTRRQSAFIIGKRARERVDIVESVGFKECGGREQGSIARLSERQVADIRSG
ncbi:hypothetical protein B0H12DRAFT_1138855 [Mycena haematopus]|nr:hypothetical protein B0H12DRAFT_1138855 [Mycena haematopus]